MAKENDLKKELLKQMDKDPDKMLEANIKSPKEIIAKDTARIKRLKWVVIISWLLVLGYWAAGAFWEWIFIFYGASGAFPRGFWTRLLSVKSQPLLLIAIILTVWLYISSRTLTMHKIQIRLANIEEHLKKMSQDK